MEPDGNKPLTIGSRGGYVRLDETPPARRLQICYIWVHGNAARNLCWPAGEVRRRTETALQLLRIEHLAGRHPARLSGGESQLVALAGLLALRPAHLVLDEPTSRLDPERSALVAEAIARVAASGVGVLLAEHDEALLARLCSRVVDL